MDFEQLTSRTGCVFAIMTFHLPGKLTEREKSQLGLIQWCLVYQHSSARNCCNDLQQLASDEIAKRASTSFDEWRRVYEFAKSNCRKLLLFAIQHMLEFPHCVEDKAYLLNEGIIECNDRLLEELMESSSTFEEWLSLIDLEDLTSDQRAYIAKRLFATAKTFLDCAILYEGSRIFPELEGAKELLSQVESNFRDWEEIENDPFMSLIEGHRRFCHEQMRLRARSFREILKVHKNSPDESMAEKLMNAATCFDHWLLVFNYSRVPRIEEIAFSNALDLARTESRLVRLFSLLPFEIPGERNFRVAERLAKLL